MSYSSRSVRVSTEYIPKVKLALRRNGYLSQRILAEDLGISQSTVSNFVTGKAVDFSYFKEICDKLGLEWRDIADLSLPDESVIQTNPPNINHSPSSPHPPHPPVAERSRWRSLSERSTSPSYLEYPEGQVALDSAFYLERPPIEQRCYEEINKPGSLIRIKAPQNMGKSSLLARILQQGESQGNITVIIDFQLAEEELFSNLNTFLRWFCDTVTEEIAAENPELQQKLLQTLDEHWKSAQRFGYMKTCKNYFERYLFPQISQPLILGLETVDKLFEYPKIYRDFFGLLRLLRALHEEAKRRDIWKKLRLVIVHSTEAYVPVDINQSPFNVGLVADLPEFTQEQVKDLAQRHQLNWNDAEVEKLMGLVGGHPFLVRLALYKIAIQEINLAQVLQTAATAEGIYSKHLQHLESILKQQPELWTAMQKVVDSSSPVFLATEIRFKLHSLGLVKLQGDEVTIRCELYRQYFLNSAKDNHN
jgi:transcriptional regulator with XRE-family HTH domain